MFFESAFLVAGLMDKGSRHIAIHVPFLGGGGAERAMANLSTELVSRGVNVDIVVSDYSRSTYISDIDPRVRVVDLGVNRHLLGLVPLVKYLRSNRPHFMITVQPPSHPLAVIACKLAGVSTKCVASVQNYHSVEFDSGVSLVRRLVLATFPYVLRRMDRVFAVAERVKADLVGNFNVPPENVEVVYNPIAAPDITEHADKRVNHPWLTEENDPVILAVGRLTAQKNYPLLLRAFAHVIKHRPVRLIILGEGEERERLQELANDLGIAEEVDLPGFADNPFAYMRSADVYALSSNWEGLPSVLIEALAVGCNIVATDCPSGPREILAGGRYGRLVPVNDEMALAEAIRDALNDNSIDRLSLRERARAFSPSAVANRYRHLLLGEERADPVGAHSPQP